MGPQTKLFFRLVFPSLIVVGASLVCVTGCKPSAEKRAAREAQINQEIESLFAQIQNLQSEGRMTEAAALVETGLNTAKYVAQKPRFFMQKVDLLLTQGKDAQACELVLQTWRREPALARVAVDRVSDYYRQRNAYAETLRWCKSLLELKDALPGDLRPQVLEWQLTAAVATRDPAAAQAAVDSAVAALPPESACELFQRILGGLIDANQHAFAQALIVHLDSRKPESPLYSNLITTLTLRCVLAAKDWPNFKPAFGACVSRLPDDPLLKVLRATFPALQKAGQNDLVEAASKQVIDTAIEKTASVNLAARVWVECGVAANKKLLPERLNALLDAKVSPIQVGNLFDRYFYDMVSDLDIIRSLCTVGTRILAMCNNDENTVNNVKVKVLDGAFIVDNFDLAVTMLEQGIPGKDKAWHEMSLPKVKAHRALAQKKPREAVQYFREFMNAWINSKQEEEFDPTSGIAYSREWILGRNANRIAKILDSIPDPAEAAKAREEAKAYFRIAVQKASKDAEATRLIKEETKDMGL